MLKRTANDRALLVLLLLTGLFNVVDFFATQDLVVYGIHGEWNPLMRPLMGTPYFAFCKLILIPLGLIFLWRVRNVVLAKFMGLVRVLCGIYGILLAYTWVIFYR